MNTTTGEILPLSVLTQMFPGKPLPPEWVPVSPQVAKTMRAGQVALARHSLSRRKRRSSGTK